MSKKQLLYILPVAIVICFFIVWLYRDEIVTRFFMPTTSSIQDGLTTTLVKSIDAPNTKTDTTNSTRNNTTNDTNQDSMLNSLLTKDLPDEPIQTIATSLEIPWEIAFLPDNSLLVTERPGQLTRIWPNEQKSIEIDGVIHEGEGGLQGLALDPKFKQNRRIYLYLTTSTANGLINRVESYELQLDSNRITNKQIVIDNIPGARYHDGGRIAFGPDGYLYIGTGDAGNSDSAQDTQSLAGKILRVSTDGSIPRDNPFNNAVYSFGHRNVQGLAWDKNGQLWASEHGPSGAQTGNDEINKIEKGKNYGWPVIKGTQTSSGMELPVIESGTKETWAPAGVEIVDETLFFVGLRGASLYSAGIVENGLVNLMANFRNEFGRLRVVKAHDGWLYLATSNLDGRGTEKENDDKIIRISLELF